MRKSKTSAGTFSVRRSKKAVATDSPSTTVRVRGRSSPTEVATNDNAASRMPADESALRYLSSWERDASGHSEGGSLRRNEVTLETSLNVTFIQWGNAIMEESLESDLREVKRKEWGSTPKKKRYVLQIPKDHQKFGEGQLRGKPCVESMDNRYCARLIGEDRGIRVPANTPCG